MASQIEDTLASLTVRSEQYKTQLDDFFKKNDSWFSDLRSRALARIKNIPHGVEVRAIPSRSPLKSLQKKKTRKLKKTARPRKNKPKHDRSHHKAAENLRAADQIGSAATHSPLLPQKPSAALGLLDSAMGTQNRDRRSKRTSSRRLTRSTSSFHSAVESPLHRLSTETPNDDQLPSGPSGGDSLRQQELGEAQWQDCIAMPEKDPVPRSKSEIPNKQPASDVNDLDATELSPNGDERRTAPCRNENSPRTPSKAGNTHPDNEKCTEVVPRNTDVIPVNTDECKPYDPLHIPRGENSCSGKKETANPEKKLPLAKSREEENVDTMVAEQRKQMAALNAKSSEADLGTDFAEANHGIRKSSDKFSVAETATDSEVLETKNSEGGKTSDSPCGASSSEQCELLSDRKSLEAQHRSKRDESEFEFKAPKPRSLTARQVSLLGQNINSLSEQRSAEEPQTPKAQTRSRIQPGILRKHSVFQGALAVGEDGNINESGVGLLSGIVSTPATGTRDFLRNSVNEMEDRSLRGTRLFKPTHDIYSSQRKPALSKTLSVQKSSLSIRNRGSFLSHTPGANAPTRNIEGRSDKMPLPAASLQDSFEVIKKSIIESNPSSGTPEGRAMAHGTRQRAADLSLGTGAQDNGVQPAGKRLTFADELNTQLRSTGFQSSFTIEPQTAPTKDVRVPRIRRDNAKSALRRRIEEIRGKSSFRGKSSSSALANDRSPRSSPRDKLLSTSSPGGNRESGGHAMVSEELTKRDWRTNNSDVERSERTTNSFKEDSTARNPSNEADSMILSDGSEMQSKSGARTSGHTRKRNISTEKAISGVGPDSEEVGGQDEDHTGAKGVASEGQKSIPSNLMASVSSLYSTASGLLGVRSTEERPEVTEADVAAKRQKMDAERREIERLARIDAQRVVRQREAEEKQRRAEARRQLLAEAEKAKEDERKRKEEHRRKIKQQEEEQRRRKKVEEDRKKEERRRQVLEKKAMNMEMQGRKKGQDGKRQRAAKQGERGMTGIPKPGGLGGKSGKSHAVQKNLGVGDLANSSNMETEKREEGGGCGDGEGGVSSYVMTPAKGTVIEESDDERERRKDKDIPEWAGGRKLATSARNQPDPDQVFVNMPMCNLREVFGTSKQYRTRSSSANWTQDRLTTSEMTKYKKAVGGFHEA